MIPVLCKVKLIRKLDENAMLSCYYLFVVFFWFRSVCCYYLLFVVFFDLEVCVVQGFFFSLFVVFFIVGDRLLRAVDQTMTWSGAFTATGKESFTTLLLLKQIESFDVHSVYNNVNVN